MYELYLYFTKRVPLNWVCLKLSERAYLSSRVIAGSAFIHAALPWKTPTFLHDWKRPFVTWFCIRFRFLVFKDVSRFEGPSRQSFCNQDLLLKSEWQIQASVTTRVRAGSLTHTFDLIFLGEFDFAVPFLMSSPYLTF